jgi:V8-like Glu-specific endopeptidase
MSFRHQSLYVRTHAFSRLLWQCWSAAPRSLLATAAIPALILHGAVAHASVDGPDDRVPLNFSGQPLSNLGYYSAIGKIPTSDGHCTGTLIAPKKMLTALHCIASQTTGNGPPPASIEFFPAFGMRNFGQPEKDTQGLPIVARGVRYIVGGAHSYLPEPKDWAIVMLDRDLTQLGFKTIGLAEASPPLGTLVHNVGYGEQSYTGGVSFRNRPGLHAGCRAIGSSDRYVITDCDVMSGNSGGPIYIVANANTAKIVADITTTQSVGNAFGGSGPSVNNFRFVPHEPRGLAVGTGQSSNPAEPEPSVVRVFAGDADQNRLVERELGTQGSDPWTAWRKPSALVEAPSRVAAINLDVWRAEQWAVTNGSLKVRSEQLQPNPGSEQYESVWGSWQAVDAPGHVIDVAASADGHSNFHLFVLTQDPLSKNTRVFYRQRSTESSAWSAWTPVGSVVSARAIAVFRNPLGTHEVLVSSPAGIYRATVGSPLSGLTLQWSAPGGFDTVSASSLTNGNVMLLAVRSDSGELQHILSSNYLSAAWTKFPAKKPDITQPNQRFDKLVSTRTPAGHHLVIGAYGGELFYASGSDVPGGAWTQFKRFY